MGMLKEYAKMAWVYTTSMFLPTAVITPRIEKAFQEYEEAKAREKAKRNVTP